MAVPYQASWAPTPGTPAKSPGWAQVVIHLRNCRRRILDHDLWTVARIDSPLYFMGETLCSW
eukprot:13401216-Alexandrium_andersonii.AAC.1